MRGLVLSLLGGALADAFHWPSNPQGLAAEILSDIENTAGCAGCKVILATLKGLARLGDTAFVDTVAEMCTLSHEEDGDVCYGAVGLEGPIIAADLRNLDLASDTSDLFCINFLGLCAYPAVPAWSVPFRSEKPSGGRPTPSGQTPIQVVHYSDVHVDPLYAPGASTDCTKPLCCRNYDPADIPGNNTSPAGPNGDHACDVPVDLEESMYAAIKDMFPDAAFSIFTGDLVEHAIWNTTQPTNIQRIDDDYGRMSKYLSLVYATAGNHESSPTNAFQPSSMGDSSQWLYDTLSNDWSGWIGSNATTEADQTGTYSVKYSGGNLRIISLNMNLYYTVNFYMYQDPMLQDPNGQISWLVTQLDAAEQAGENVWIIGHEPMGGSDIFHSYSNYLDQVVNRYSATIAAMFFGHTHVDQFQLSYSDYSNQTYQTAEVVSYICPSLTPTSGMPSFRVYDIDPITFSVLDAVTYAANMSDPAFQTTGPVWTKYYSAKETYGPLVTPPLTDPSAQLSAAFWHNVTEVFANDQGAFDGYTTRKSRGWRTRDCAGDCRSAEICRMRAARSQDNCYTPPQGVSFSKRAKDQVRERDDCGASVTKATLSALAKRRDMVVLLQKRYEEKKAAKVRLQV